MSTGEEYYTEFHLYESSKRADAEQQARMSKRSVIVRNTLIYQVIDTHLTEDTDFIVLTLICKQRADQDLSLADY